MHSNHVTVNGEKVSKSLGNGIRLQEIVEKGYSPEVVRLHILESHYRSQSKFSWESLEAAKNRLQDILAMADLRWQIIETRNPSPQLFDDAMRNIKSALEDDLNTPKALAALSDVASKRLSILSMGSRESLDKFLGFIDAALGLGLSGRANITNEQTGLITERENARRAQDWSKSDSIRSDLAAQGINLEDFQTGSVWYRS
jgi:cysteinyl-tRNA synthetase